MKNKKSSNFSLLGASGNSRGDVRVCTDGPVLALGDPAFAQTNSTEKEEKNNETTQEQRHLVLSRLFTSRDEGF